MLQATSSASEIFNNIDGQRFDQYAYLHPHTFV